MYLRDKSGFLGRLASDEKGAKTGMQRKIRWGAALLLAFTVVGVDAASVGAQSHEFIANKTGKVISKQTDTQIFKTAAGSIECKKASGTGEIKEGSSTTNKEVVTYSGCSGFGGGIKISAAHFEFSAEGHVKLEQQLIIKPEGTSCEVILEPQTLESVGYTNNTGGKVTTSSSVTKIHSFGTGGVCGGEEETAGSYSGSIQAELEGGTLEWK
jgi:hypothetical protein